MTTTQGPRARPHPRIDALSVICSDLGRSVAFYRALGCDLPEPDGTGHLACDLGGVSLMLDSEEVLASFAPDEPVPQAPNRVTLAARCATPEAVDALHDELVPMGRGSLMAPFDAFWGQRYAVVLDPDGSSVDLYCDQPGAPVLQAPPT
ncbi:VOC family protein [Jannaschia sp. R86511]|uniref:VOC family protein n=1 Tax=Jannaschia sp. R86511 TaxID=3093853 RepID=UPI0036D2495B